MKKLNVLLLALSFIILTACSQSPEVEIGKVYQGSPTTTTTNTTTTTTTTPTTPTTPTTNQESMSTFDQTAMPEAGEQVVNMKTSMGTIKLRLFPTHAPKTVENFVGLIEKDYYNGIIFHRIIPNFMIHGGDPTGTGTAGESLWGGKFEDEGNKELSNMPGSIAMANAGPNTNGSQFFINQANNDFLDCHNPTSPSCHTVFGQVIEGMDVVEKIINTETGPGDKPVEDVVMKKVTMEEYSK